MNNNIFNSSQQNLENLQRKLKHFEKFELNKIFIPSGEVIKLLSTINIEETTFEEIARLVEKDKNLCIRILRIANSPVFGFSGRITSIEQALLLLGIKVLRAVILTLPVLRKSRQFIPHLEDHSFKVGTGARILAEIGELKNISEVATAGIVHDLGKTVIAEFLVREGEFGKKMLKYLYIDKIGKAGLQKEREIFGTDHVEIGEKLAKTWSFPERLIKLISSHHNPVTSENNGIETKCIYIANLLSYFNSPEEFDKRKPEILPEEDLEILNLFEISSSEMKRIIEDINKEWLTLKELFL
uniref:HDOD domain-containing protein n=1 Tax=Thermodesulfobacterium geofontis TaxID=1295609 RepID=A0A7C4P171_9BACT